MSEALALLAEELAALPLLELDHAAIDGALQAQGKLATNRRISHRVKPVDLLVAAVADRHGAAVLHYDSDYDLIAKHTDLRFDSVWAAKRGSGRLEHVPLPSDHRQHGGAGRRHPHVSRLIGRLKLAQDD